MLLGSVCSGKESIIQTIAISTVYGILRTSLVFRVTAVAWSGKVGPFVCLFIVLRRISDYGYITGPLKSPFTTRWGYGGRILDFCPFDISVVVGAFVIGLGQISSFLS